MRGVSLGLPSCVLLGQTHEALLAALSSVWWGVPKSDWCKTARMALQSCSHSYTARMALQTCSNTASMALRTSARPPNDLILFSHKGLEWITRLQPGAGAWNLQPGAGACNLQPGAGARSPEPGPGTCSPEPGPGTCSPEPGPATCSPEPGPGTCSPEPGPGTCSPEPGPGTCSPEPGPGTCSPEPGPGTGRCRRRLGQGSHVGQTGRVCR